MKNKFKLLSLLLIANGVYAQQNPTNTNPGGAASGMQSQQYWSRAGNNNNNGANNIFGTLWNSPIYTQTNGVTRIVLRGGGTGNNAGRMALGNNLVGAFTPANRLHLHQTGGDFGIRFTNNTTGNSASNGFGMDLLDNGRFQFSQYQDQDVLFKMPNSLLMQLIWDNDPNNGGQVKIGPTSNPPLNIGNPMYNPALVNLGGALAFSHPASGNANNTLI